MRIPAIIIVFGFLLLYHSGISQVRTVGLMHYSEEVEDGYILFTPHGNTTAYLIDNCGGIVHQWVSDHPPGNAVYLQEDGSIFRAGRIDNDVIHAGGAGGIIEQISWEGQVLWDFEYNNDSVRAHHDFQVLPNGNILILAWESRTREEAEALGMNPERLDSGLTHIWPEQIIEIDPNDNNKIVWYWTAWDHMIQDFDSTKLNYGVVSEHPEKIDINYVRPGRTDEDWMHANSIHYNEELDQIVISVLFFDEIWIIDHGISTEEASGPKGDLLFRWGNPRAYIKGDKSDQQLFGQHNAHWIDKGLKDENKIMVFNNGAERFEDDDSLYTSVVILDVNNDGKDYPMDDNGVFLPENFFWEYTAENRTSFYSRFISGAQQQSNGNVLINSGAFGTFFEVNQDKEVVWEYVNPVTRDGIAVQGESIFAPNNSGRNPVFRAERYPSDYEAFINRNLNSLITIEPGNDFQVCEAGKVQSDIMFYPNPVSSTVTINDYEGEYIIHDLRGMLMKSGSIDEGQLLDLSDLRPGVYALSINGLSYPIFKQ